MSAPSTTTARAWLRPSHQGRIAHLPRFRDVLPSPPGTLGVPLPKGEVRKHSRSGVVAVLLLILLPAVRAVAGGGPENVLLVVNRSSPDSLCIANHYIRLRRIPAGNVLTLPWDPKAAVTDIDTFRDKILRPVVKAIEQRRLGSQIDYVVYSCDFPTGISFDKDVDQFMAAAKAAGEKSQGDEEKKAGSSRTDGKLTWPNVLTKVAAINGLTFLWQPVLAAKPLEYAFLKSNTYFRNPGLDKKEATVAFRATQQYGPAGEMVSSGGRTYLLSMMLGVTSVRGNSRAEIIRYLERSAAADGTRPRGTIYYLQNSDIRSRSRQAGFPAAMQKLKDLGVAAEIVDGVLPMKKDDVQGLMAGTAAFDWKSSGSTILPGAICEHFTSFGGILNANNDQTPLSEFLRYGAAGSSGTVVEPYSIAEKFPAPALHVHYARGCTLAEAFYQSVAGPYQLLIVGDPLCRPWANIPKVTVSGVTPGAAVKGKVTLKPAASFPREAKVDRFELFVDDLRTSGCGPDGTIELDTARLADGHHELRVVAFEAGPIRSQGRAIVPIVAANHGRTITASITPSGTVPMTQRLTVTAKSPKAMGIAVLHNSHLLGKINGESGQLQINPAVLGAGPVRLRIVGLGDGTPLTYTWAAPIEVTLEKR